MGSSLDPGPWHGQDPPLVAGMIHGLRSWSIEFDAEGNGRLQGYAGTLWEQDGTPTVAHCPGASRRSHRAPSKSCQCGLYAYHPGRRSATEVFPDPNLDLYSLRVSGLVEAWGSVEVHLDGFRAQYARPFALILPRDYADGHLGGLVRAIARAHRAEVLVPGDPRELAEHCRAHGLGLSRATVARLVPEEQRTLSAPAVSQTPGRRTLGDLVGGTIAVISILVGVAFWLAVWGGIALAILGAIFGWFGDDSRSATTIARGHLKVVDQAVLGAASREPVYVAVIENDDSRRAALGVAPRLMVDGSHRASELASSGSFDHPANVPPGGAAVAVDRPPVVPTGALREPRFHVAAFRRAPKFPIKRVVARLDRTACTLTAEVTASQRLQDLRLIALARQGGHIVGGGEFRVDSVPSGRSTHKLGKPGVRSCGAEPPRWSLYPALAPSDGKWRD